MADGRLGETTVGILYCGDMGSAVGRLLRAAGFRVVTTCEGRSVSTARQAESLPVEILPTLDDVVAQSDIVFSVVLPSAAVDVARQYASRRALCPARSLFVEANTIGMKTLTEIGEAMATADLEWIDAGIHGTASQLAKLGVVYVSGPDSALVGSLCNQTVLPVVKLGDAIGMASSMKLLMAGMSKSTAAAFFEIGALAEHLGLLDAFLESYAQFYPDVMHGIHRTLPTYPQHAARRVGDVRNLEECAEAISLRLPLMHEVGNLMERLTNVKWDPDTASQKDVASIIRSARDVVAGQSILEGAYT